MKKILLCIAVFPLLFSSTIAQVINSGISAGNDTTVCNGGNITLHATLNVLPTVSSTGITLTDDQYSTVINIGFPFNFYGNNYTQCLISTNGYITFDLSGAGGYSPWSINASIPSSSDPTNAIMGPWQDLLPSTTAGSILYATFGTAPNRTFVVQWDNPMFSCTSICFGNQIMLYEGSNIIETHIGNKPLCTGWNSGQAIHGLQNASGTVACVVPGRNANQQWTTVLEGKRFSPSSGNYSISAVPYNPVFLGVAANSVVTWANLAGTTLATSPNLTVSPVNNTYYVCSVSSVTCGGTSQSSSFTYYDTVMVGISNPQVTTWSQNADCLSGNGGMVAGAVTGAALPYTWSWNTIPPANTDSVFNVSVGTYTATLTDANGCIATGTATVTQQGTMNSAIVSTIDLLCNGIATGNLEVVGFGATAPYTYILANDTAYNGIFSNLQAGIHDVLIVDSIGCTAHQLVTINEPAAALGLLITTHQDIDCKGNSNGKFEIAANGGTAPYTYSNSLTSNSSGMFGNLYASHYLLSVTDANGCYMEIHDSIIQPEKLVASIANYTDVTCNGLFDGTATANITGGVAPYVKSWSNNPGVDVFTMTAMPAGTHDLTVSDNNGCNTLAQVTIAEPQALSISAPADISMCESFDTLMIAYSSGGTGTLSYNWMPGNLNGDSARIAPIVNTSYLVTVTDKNGCTISEPVEVTVYKSPDPEISLSSDHGCQSFCPTFTDLTQDPAGSVVASTKWDFGDGTIGETRMMDHCYNNEGVYSINLTVTTDKGCRKVEKFENYITVFGNPNAQVFASPTETSISNPSIVFTNNTTGGADYFWNFGDNDSIFNVLEQNHTYQDTGLYIVNLVAISSNGCVDSIKTIIRINPYYTFFLPTSFTPNGDGKNDVFEIRGDYIQSCSMEVFDRWGKVLFSQSGGKNVSWDGNNNPQGSYIYRIKMVDTQNKQYEYCGDLTILR